MGGIGNAGLKASDPGCVVVDLGRRSDIRVERIVVIQAQPGKAAVITIDLTDPDTWSIDQQSSGNEAYSVVPVFAGFVAADRA